MVRHPSADDKSGVVPHPWGRIPLHYRCRGPLFRPRPLRQAEYPGELGVRQGHAHLQLPRSGSMDYRPCRQSRAGSESVLCHHAGGIPARGNNDGHNSGNRCQSGTYQRLVHHLQRGHEPALLATATHKISHRHQRTALHTVHQYQPLRPVHRRYRLLPHIEQYGGRLRTGHHGDDAHDDTALGLLPPAEADAVGRFSLPVIRFFVVLESIFFVANLAKIPLHGGWVTIFAGGNRFAR